MKNTLLSTIEKSTTILITSHFCADPDAFCSVAFVYEILKLNFKDKQIYANIEEFNISKYKAITGVEEISKRDTLEIVKEIKPDLIIILDGNNWKRVSKERFTQLEEVVTKLQSKIVVIDHHPIDDVSRNDMLINNMASSTAEEVYRVFVKELKLERYPRYYDAILLGILSDTGRFLHNMPNPKTTFSIVSELIAEGANIEYLESLVSTITPFHIKVFEEMAKNFVCTDKYNYTYLSDKFVNRYSKHKDFSLCKEAYYMFFHEYLRSVGENKWGFTILPRVKKFGQKRKYDGSFRCKLDVIDTRIFTKQMNGNGHKCASGFRIEAQNIKEALKTVQDVIEKNYKQK